ncbi:MAG: protein adenylyltransferase SelO [Chthoniobacterales bacterium]
MSADSDLIRPAGWRFDNSYTRLPAVLFCRVKPVPVRVPSLVVLNESLALSLGLDAGVLAADGGAAFFAGNAFPPGVEPIAQAYAGHQFGHFTNLGDGRAILLGEQVAPAGRRFDLQLKGSGRTPYSRGGDGRAALGPMLREYIISEAMHALGIPTTRGLAVTTTGESVVRAESLPGAVLTRVAASHIRVGTFEYASALGDRGVLSALLDYTLLRHDPELSGAENRALALLDAVIERQASLLARWLNIGFVHGVMNTDNMALSGETIDYGPCAFMDTYDPGTVFSSIDHHGRYAYANQPRIAQWNLARLAEALLPLIHEDAKRAVVLAEESVQKFGAAFQRHWLDGMRAKLGLFNEEDDDLPLAQDLLSAMQEARSDFTNTFVAMGKPAPGGGQPFLPTWEDRWRDRLRRQPQDMAAVMARMRSANPQVIPRNHRVEEALAAAGQGDFTVMRRLLEVLGKPYADGEEHAPYRQPPGTGIEPYRTFCGT